MSKVDNNYKDNLSWDEKARINPLFAIMSEDQFSNSNSKPTVEELESFYQKGRYIWNRNLQPAFISFSEPSKIKVLEYGCGMGRLLKIPLAMGAECYGIDISSKQLDLAKEYTFPTTQPKLMVLIPKNRINIEDSSIDFVYSYAVLQHIQNTSDFLFAIDEMIRLTKKGGIIKIQIRTPNKFAKQGKVAPVFNISFEKSTLLVYLRKTGLFYLPWARLLKHTHWSGAGGYYNLSRLMNRFKSKKIEILSIEFEATGNLVWLTCTKR